MAVGRLNSVMVRLFYALAEGEQLGVQPARNSVTGPLTSNESPTLTEGALPVNTKMPSEVAGLVSGLGSCK